MTEPERLIVLAGNLAQFRLWCRLAGRDPRDRRIVYARDRHALDGIRGDRIIRYGTWYLRSDAQALDAYARARTY